MNINIDLIINHEKFDFDIDKTADALNDFNINISNNSDINASNNSDINALNDFSINI